MKRLVVAALLLVLATAAEGEIVLGPARPLTPKVATGPVYGDTRDAAVASMGDQFLVGWSDTRNGSLTARAMRISASGELLDPIPISFPDRSGLFLSVGSSGSEYLVVTDRALWIVTRDGEVIPGDLVHRSLWIPKVISNGIDYIVSDGSGYSFRVDRSGKWLGEIGGTWRAALGTLYVGEEYGYDRRWIRLLALDGTVTKFPVPDFVAMTVGKDEIALLCCRYGVGHSITRFRADGAQIGPNIPIYTPPLVYYDGYLAWDIALGWDGTSYVAFYAPRPFAAEKTMLGIERGGRIVLEPAPFTARSPLLASSRHGVLAVWSDARFQRPWVSEWHQVAAMLLQHDSDLAAARDVIVSISEHTQSSPRIESAGGRQLVTFIERSAPDDEIVVAPVGGGDEPLRISLQDYVYGLRTASNGEELFLLWASRTRDFVMTWHAAIVTAGLQAKRFEIGTFDVFSELNVLWSGSEYVVYGANIGLRFAPGGVPLLPPAPFQTLSEGWLTPSAAFTGGKTYLAYSHFRQSNISAGPLGWYEIYAGQLPFEPNPDGFIAVDTMGTSPELAAAGKEVVVVTQLSAFTLLDPHRYPYLSHEKIGQNLWSTLSPHVVARDGAFLVTAGGTIARVVDGKLVESATLPESVGVKLGFNDFDIVLESAVPKTGPMTLAYVVSGHEPTRIWLRDITLPPRRRTAAH